MRIHQHPTSLYAKHFFTVHGPQKMCENTVQAYYLLHKITEEFQPLLLLIRTSFKDNLNEYFIWLCGKAEYRTSLTYLYGQSYDYVLLDWISD